MRLVTVLLNLLCWAFLGLNIWVITTGRAGPFNYVAAAMCLGGGLYNTALAKL